MSNVRAADYVGPATCGECHGDQFEQWSGNLHRSMNRLASEVGAVVGDFSGVAIAYAEGQASFVTRAGVATMVLVDRDGVSASYRVTRTIGSRYIQEYVGVQTEPDTSSVEVRLPFGYWLRERRWFHQQYFDSWFGREYDERGAPTINAYDVDPTPWAARCAWCHNTYPFELRVARAHGVTPTGFGPEALVTLSRAPTVTGNVLPSQELVSVGVSCESCHFGGREHVGGAAIEFRPRSPQLSAATDRTPISGERNDARTINVLCAQCHSAPSPTWPSGAAKRNSSEALDFLGGACSGALKCTDCHDPHQKGEAAGAASRPTTDIVCVGCHSSFRVRSVIANHTHHQASTVACIDCHMPRIVQGFSGPLRTHRISSPDARAVLDGGEPNACGLCHLERSSRQLALDLSAGWDQQPGTGDWDDGIDRPIGERWLKSDQPIVVVTAAAAYGLVHRGTGDRIVAAKLADLLDQEIAYYRMRVLFALEEVLGRDIPLGVYDPTAAPKERSKRLRALQNGLR